VGLLSNLIELNIYLQKFDLDELNKGSYESNLRIFEIRKFDRSPNAMRDRC
jgi:hypothetical protein